MDVLIEAASHAVNGIIELVKFLGGNFYRNLFGMWKGMDMVRWIRLIAVVGVYWIFRGWVVKKAEEKQAREHAALMESEGRATLSPNALRGEKGKKVSFKESTGEDEDAAKASGLDEGKKAKKREKQLAKKQAQEVKKTVEWDGEDSTNILDQLVDYEEGEDGW